MLACRLHFERANREAAEIVESGTIGKPRLFSSIFCAQARPRKMPRLAGLRGSPLYDVGFGCIDAARHVFQSDPIEVLAMISQGRDGDLRGTEEGTSVILRFSGDRLASLSCGLGGYALSSYLIVGTRGELRVEPRYELEDLGTGCRAQTADKSIDDVHLLEAIFESAASKRPVMFEPARRRRLSTSAPAPPPIVRLMAAPLGVAMIAPAR